MGGANQAILVALFRAAVGAVAPGDLVRRHLVRSGDGVAIVRGGRALMRLDHGAMHLVAAGKAASGMALAAASVLGGRLAGGVAVAPEMPRGLPRRIRCFAARHPLPDHGSLRAGRAAWEMLGRLGPDDGVLVLLSGGAS
ncbi:MAG: DUF4147 domain-containing protein, partial [Candidatus Binatia bacterium]